MSIKLNSSGGGSVTLQEPVTASTRTLDLPDATGTVVAANSSGNVSITSLTVDSNNISAVNSLGFRNRIINGDMRIDQRNAGASVTNIVGSVYSVDRFPCWGSVASKYTAQQSSTSATGFSKSLLITSSSAYSVGSSDFFGVQHRIEGFNTADLGWGSAGAQSVTLSFWVRSSLTGTFGGSFKNADNTRSYVFTYTISASNTWEQKTVTVTGDTSGTWETTNSLGIVVTFSLGVGSTFSGTAGSWASANYWSTTGATSVVGTNGATFYITGVQLEAGTVASPFERRPYGEMLTLCQRYFEAVTFSGIYVADLFPGSSGQARGVIVPFTVQKRATPTISYSSASYTSTFSPSSGQIVVWSVGAAGIYTGNSGGTSVLTTFGNISTNNVNTGINNVNIGAAANGLIGIGGSTVFASSEL